MKNRRFTDELRQYVNPIWKAIHEHECINKLGDGTLEIEKYRYFLVQDYLYLEEYGKVLALTAIKAPKAEISENLLSRTVSTLLKEKTFILEEAQAHGVSRKDIGLAIKAPTIQAYTDFMIRTAALGSCSEAMAALLVCNWNFHEIGIKLSHTSCPANAPCINWVKMYTSSILSESVKWYRESLDVLAEGLPQRELLLIKKAFITGSRYEYLLWNAVNTLEMWADCYNI